MINQLIDGWRRPGVKWLVAFTVALVAITYFAGVIAARAETAAVPVDNTVKLALIVAGSTFATSMLMALVNNWSTRRQKRDEAAERQREKIAENEARRQDKQDDWRRQDEVAAKLLVQQELAATRTAEALAVAKATAVKIDGMLSDRDKANEAIGVQKQKLVGVETARTLAEGQRQGREMGAAGQAPVSVSVPEGAAALVQGKKPVDVADDRTAKAAERSADAQERTADANEAKK